MVAVAWQCVTHLQPCGCGMTTAPQRVLNGELMGCNAALDC